MTTYIQKLLLLLSVLVLGVAGIATGQPGTRIKLTQLEQAPSIDGSRKGMIGLSNAAGDQRYAFYVNVADTCITYTPADTGNTTVSIFVQKCGTDSIWYIDYEGRSILLAPFGGAGSCDVDWLQISDNSCPDAITDSIYKQKYASIGARLVWPGAELLVNDSTGSAISVVQGSRNARLALYDSNSGTFTMFDHGGTAPVTYMPVGGTFTFKTVTGTPQTPIAQVNHFGINASDSTIQMFQYPRTRVDTQSVVNFLYTDPVGKIRSKPTSSFPLTGLGGIYSGSGTIPDGTEATLSTSGSFVIKNSGVSGNALEIVDNDYCSLVGPSGGTVGVDNTGAASLSGTSGGQVTALGANVLLQPNNGGPVIIGGASTVSPLRFLEPSGSGTNYSSFQAQAQAADITYILPAADGSSGQVLSTNGGGGLAWITAGGGSGTVTSFSAGNLSPLFTTSVATATTTPALTFSLSNANANTVLAGPTSGGAAAPTYRALVAADLPTGAGGVFIDGGNSFGAAGTLGTNDANALNIETNNVIRATVTGGTSTGGAWTCTDVTANTNTNTENVVTYQYNSTGTPSTNFGAGIGMYLKTSTTDNREAASMRWYWTNATEGAQAGKLGWSVGTGGAAPVERMALTSSTSGTLSIGSSSAVSITNTGITTATGYTIGGSAQTLTLSSSSASTGAIFLSSTASGVPGPGILFGNASYTSATLAKTGVRIFDSYAPTSGSGTYTGMDFTGTFNQTGGASGIIRSFYVNPTLTAVADFRSYETTVNTANAFGFYQSGANSPNYFNGKTGVGDSSPETQLDVAGTAGVVRLIGQDNTPTITVDAAQAGTGASASMTNAQSSDLAGRFSITTGTGATTGRWATITFGAAYATTPVVILGCEDADCAGTGIGMYVNVSTTAFEVFITGSPVSSTTHEFAFHIIGGK